MSPVRIIVTTKPAGVALGAEDWRGGDDHRPSDAVIDTAATRRGRGPSNRRAPSGGTQRRLYCGWPALHDRVHEVAITPVASRRSDGECRWPSCVTSPPFAAQSRLSIGGRKANGDACRVPSSASGDVERVGGKHRRGRAARSRARRRPCASAERPAPRTVERAQNEQRASRGRRRALSSAILSRNGQRIRTRRSVQTKRSVGCEEGARAERRRAGS